MTDCPIIFSAPMIRALLAGRKTQTRRILKPKKGITIADFEQGEPHTSGIGHWMRIGRDMAQEPRFEVGDRLWVRENFAVNKNAEPRIYPKGEGHPWGSPIYKATFGGGLTPICEGFSPWKPSVHMPRWASRLTLIVESVKVERLKDISEADAIAEGMRETRAPDRDGMRHFGTDGPGGLPTARLAFFELLTAINGADSYRANPWVAAITFRVVRANIDALCEEVAP